MIAFDLQFVGEQDTIKWEAADVSSHVTDLLAVAVLDKGMASGRPSCMLRVPLADGTVAIVETSARVWVAVATAIMGRYPELLEGD